MCGIVGYVGKKGNALHVLIDGLKNLEYRGYDSAGIAYIEDKNLNIIKTKGKIAFLEEKIDFSTFSNLGIGHTRWATHGEPNEVNAHPHQTGKFTIVHNGIIENYMELKRELQKEYNFKSNTDTEVACALLDKLYRKTNDIVTTIEEFKKQAKGAYALGIICSDYQEYLYAIKKDSPLIIGIGKGANYIASDVPAILRYTNQYIVLEDGEFAKLTSDDVVIYSKENKLVTKEIRTFNGTLNDIEKNGYDHFMLKEIHEQPDVIKNTIATFIENDITTLVEKMPDFSKYKKIDIVACGSAYHTGLIGKTLIEEFANIPVSVEIASEYRYKKLFLNKETLVIVISQSGETADTRAALEIAKQHGSDTLGIINVKESTIAREAGIVLYTEAGQEIAVATTKAYSAQVAILSLITLNIAYRKHLLDQDIETILEDIRRLPVEMQKLLDNEKQYQTLAQKIYQNNDIFFIGRDIDYALCMEGSLKLKEISYIHSEAYAAGELKHGTISLIEKGTPVIAIVTEEKIAEKTISNIKEVKARGAYVILETTEKLEKEEDFYDDKIVIPNIHKLLRPLLAVIPLQLIAYEVAKLKHCDIDKPKNLAKSVTVE